MLQAELRCGLEAVTIATMWTLCESSPPGRGGGVGGLDVTMRVREALKRPAAILARPVEPVLLDLRRYLEAFLVSPLSSSILNPSRGSGRTLPSGGGK